MGSITHRSPSRRQATALARAFAALLFFLPLLAAAPPAATPATRPATGPARSPTVVYLVRHAEKSVTYRGPDETWPISDEGRRRAEALRRELADADIGAIHVSDRLRTRQTAEPLADAIGLELVAPADLPGRGEANDGEAVAAYARRLARHVREMRRGQATLVVGHSNTLPSIAAALGVRDRIELAEHEYDDLFVITLPGDGGPPTLARRRYGPPNPPM